MCTQVAEHLLYDIPGVVYRRSIDEVKRHHVKKFDLVMVNHTLSELCSDKDRDSIITDLWSQVADGGCLVISERGNRWVHCVALPSKSAFLLAFLCMLSLRGKRRCLCVPMGS